MRFKKGLTKKMQEVVHACSILLEQCEDFQEDGKLNGGWVHDALHGFVEDNKRDD